MLLSQVGTTGDHSWLSHLAPRLSSAWSAPLSVMWLGPFHILGVSSHVTSWGRPSLRTPCAVVLLANWVSVCYYITSLPLEHFSQAMLALFGTAFCVFIVSHCKENSTWRAALPELLVLGASSGTQDSAQHVPGAWPLFVE